MSRVLSYEKKDTAIDALCGVTKLIFFLLWSITSMLTYDTRVLLVMFIMSIVIFIVSKTELRQVRKVFSFILFFLCINLIAIFIFSPEQGTLIYGTDTKLFHVFGNHTLNKEQLFYEFNIFLKYMTVVPAVFTFMVTTNPSEFAASLNRIGVSYNIGYSVAIALRYIPDVQDDFVKIRNAQAARGIEMSSKANLNNRIKNVAAIIFPLVFTSMDRINVISNAMVLRGFGKHKKRSWYSARPLKRNDYIVIVFSVLLSVTALYITFKDGSRFYNPFI